MYLKQFTKNNSKCWNEKDCEVPTKTVVWTGKWNVEGIEIGEVHWPTKGGKGKRGIVWWCLIHPDREPEPAEHEEATLRKRAADTRLCCHVICTCMVYCYHVDGMLWSSYLWSSTTLTHWLLNLFFAYTVVGTSSSGGQSSGNAVTSTTTTPTATNVTILSVM